MKHITQITCFLLLFSIANSANSASFDCDKASTFVEKGICDDEIASKLDEELAAAYKRSLAASESPEKLKREQRTWLKMIRNRCQTMDCVNSVTRGRISELSGNQSPNKGCYQQATQSANQLNNQKKYTEAYDKYKEANQCAKSNKEKIASLAGMAVTSVRNEDYEKSKASALAILEISPENKWAERFCDDNAELRCFGVSQAERDALAENDEEQDRVTDLPELPMNTEKLTNILLSLDENVMQASKAVCDTEEAGKPRSRCELVSMVINVADQLKEAGYSLDATIARTKKDKPYLALLNSGEFAGFMSTVSLILQDKKAIPLMESSGLFPNLPY